MSVGAYEDARAVAERALEAIPAQEEDERMNIWIAYLNLENSHGLRIKRGCLETIQARREFSRSKETVPRLGRHVHARGTNSNS